MQIVAELLDSETVTVSENMDITDSSIAQLCIPTTSDAATQVPMTKTRSVSVSVHMKGRDKGKRLLHNYKISQHNIHRNTNRHQPCKTKQCCNTMQSFECATIGNVSTSKCIT